jgi:glycogen(starch) synthase
LRILLSSYHFAPSVGGLETASAILADQYSRLGAVVTVVTSSAGSHSCAAYEIVRCPSLKQLCKLAGEVDAVHSDNLSIRTIAPLLLTCKPVVITHHTWCMRTNGQKGWEDHVKLALFSARCRNVAISKAVADRLPMKSTIIGEPFDPAEFLASPGASREKDIVFLGRLVRDKGCDLLLRALAILREEGVRPSLSVIGDGPEMATLRQLAAELVLSDQVTFRGTISVGRGEEIARHKILVVPSRWEEPFGIVALEGISAGCAVLASQSGGLPEAVGSCGKLFPNGDVVALASGLKNLLSNSSTRDELLTHRSEHLEKFRPENVAKRYLEVFASGL